jgi:hypothetical protein
LKKANQASLIPILSLAQQFIDSCGGIENARDKANPPKEESKDDLEDSTHDDMNVCTICGFVCFGSSLLMVLLGFLV